MRKNFIQKGAQRLVVFTLLTLSYSATSQTTAPITDVVNIHLEKELERIAKLAKGKVGISAVHLESGKRISMNLHEKYPMASTVKIAIAVQLFTKIEKGELSLMTMVDLQPSDLHPGSGTLDVLFAKPGVQLSVQNLLELMMTISDNSATDILLRLAGGQQAVMERLKTLGIADMSVDRTIIQLIADLEGITLPAEEQWVHGFYDSLWKNTTPESRLAAELKLRNETGSLNASATDDVGIITLPDGAGHVAIAVFVASSAQPLAEREQTIAHLTRAVYDYFLFQTPLQTSTSR